MILDVHGRPLANPTAADIEREIPDVAPQPGLRYWLGAATPSALEAWTRADGRFDLSRHHEGRTVTASLPVSGAELRTLFHRFAAGDHGLDRHMVWSGAAAGPAGQNPAKKREMGFEETLAAAKNGDTNAILKIAGFGALIIGMPFIANLYFGVLFSAADLPLPPALDSIPARFVAFFAIFFIIVSVIITVIAGWSIWRMRSWQPVTARIVTSHRGRVMRAAKHDALAAEEDAAVIAFDYQVDGVLYRSDKVTASGKVEGSGIDDYLARYPVGAIVTAYVDPANPASAVVERDPPREVVTGCLGVFVGGLVAAVVAMWLLTLAAKVVTEILPGPRGVAVVVLSCVALVLGGIGLAVFRQAQKVAAFPRVPGRVMQSKVAPAGKDLYSAFVEYAYEVNGRTYRSRAIQFNARSAGSRGFAEKEAARYPKDAVVEVRYDPKRPDQAGLENPIGLGLVFAFLGGAAAIGAGLVVMFAR